MTQGPIINIPLMTVNNKVPFLFVPTLIIS